ncbi:hypothetical protein NUM3379_25860 [Kineococcus sp. NUM-3379]
MSGTASTDPLPAGPALLAAALAGGVAAFQVALAAGAPWGAAAWGGGNPGVLPPGLRAASAGSAAVYVLLAAAAASRRFPPRGRRRVLGVASGVMVLGTALNLASPSGVERALWTPVAAGLAVTLWLAREAGPRRAG